MFNTAKIFYLHTISPTHVGSGSDLGIVDLPIQREGHTGFPKIEASSLKGSLRSAFEIKAKDDDEMRKKIHLTFGCDGCEKDFPDDFKDKKDREFAGSLGFSDARILLFPIKSAKSIFAWITCPLVLKQFMKDLQISENKQEFDIQENTVTPESTINIDANSVILEEYQITVIQTEKTKTIADFLAKQLKNEEIKQKLVILPNDTFKDFITLSTEVITRTKINNETGVVEAGALFTEEYLPGETIMYSLALAAPIMAMTEKPIVDDLKTSNDVMDFFVYSSPDIMQIGGNATLGKGIVSLIIGEEN